MVTSIHRQESEVRRDERCREKRKNKKHGRNANAARREKLTDCRKWSGIAVNKAGNGREKSGLGRRVKRVLHNNKEQITIRLPVELKEKLQQEADRKGYTITDLILFILWNAVLLATAQE